MWTCALIRVSVKPVSFLGEIRSTVAEVKWPGGCWSQLVANNPAWPSDAYSSYRKNVTVTEFLRDLSDRVPGSPTNISALVSFDSHGLTS